MESALGRRKYGSKYSEVEIRQNSSRNREECGLTGLEKMVRSRYSWEGKSEQCFLFCLGLTKPASARLLAHVSAYLLRKTYGSRTPSLVHRRCKFKHLIHFIKMVCRKFVQIYILTLQFTPEVGFFFFIFTNLISKKILFCFRFHLFACDFEFLMFRDYPYF